MAKPDQLLAFIGVDSAQTLTPRKLDFWRGVVGLVILTEPRAAAGTVGRYE